MKKIQSELSSKYKICRVSAVQKYVIVEPVESVLHQKLIFCDNTHNGNSLSEGKLTDDFNKCCKYSLRSIGNLMEWKGTRTLPNIRMAVKIINLPVLEKILKNQGMVLVS